MLHWLAGQRPADRGNDEYLEPPETPAPLFAVRAFKQAIFGTPAPNVSPKARRNSTHDREAARASVKPSRPVMARPRSANDANAGLRIDDMPPSPTKGILLTPGTIGERRKTVTFGDFVSDKAGRAGQNEVDGSKEISLKRGNPFETRIGREEAERKSRKQSASISPPLGFDGCRCCNGSRTLDTGSLADEEPDCAVGKYWKREYDIYRDNTSRELRKLITKQQAAKNYAREKDEQCTVLTDELRDERRKVDRLESKSKDMEALLEDLRLQLAQAKAETTTRPARSPVLEMPSPPMTATESALTHAETVVDVKPARNYILSEVSGNARSSDLSGKDTETPAYSSRRRPRRHDSFEPGSSFTISDIKESTFLADLPKPSAPAVPVERPQLSSLPPLSETKSIVSKDGEVIPPDRVAAARARLAARRQQRTAS